MPKSSDAETTIKEITRPRLLGEDVEVPLVSGRYQRYINLDYAASAPPLISVVEEVVALLPYYSSVHRGAGYKSIVSTNAYEHAREEVRSFFNAQEDDAVIFTRNTTDSVNMLASSLPENASVVTYASEHHANMLPWRRGPATVAYLDCPHSSDESLASLEAHFRLHRDTALVAVTGASNVTGELWPIGELSDIAHRYGARLLVDAAQLAPHAEVDMCGLGIDYLVASGHKLYAPFGAGVLVGPSDWLKLKDPWLMGGGAVEFVTTDSVLWSGLPERQEAGSPNVVGAVALGSALKALSSYGMARLEKDEMAIGDYARERLRTVPGIKVYSLWGSAARRIGVVTFNLAGYDHSLVAAILSAEYGVGVRHGCFCAHPLVVELLGLTAKDAARLRARLLQGEHPVMPGAVRASIGIGTMREDVDYLVEALAEIVASGPHWRYSRDARTGDYLPEADPRPWPEMGWAKAAGRRSGGVWNA